MASCKALSLVFLLDQHEPFQRLGTLRHWSEIMPTGHRKLLGGDIFLGTHAHGEGRNINAERSEAPKEGQLLHQLGPRLGSYARHKAAWWPDAS